MSIVDAVIEMLKDLESRCPRCGDDVPALAPPAQLSPKVIRDEAIVSDEERVDAWLADFASGGWIDERVSNLRPALLDLLRAVRAESTSAERTRIATWLEQGAGEKESHWNRVYACSLREHDARIHSKCPPQP